MTVAELLVPEFDQEIAKTRAVLERVPEGAFAYKPHKKSMALGQLAGHVAELPEWLTLTMKTEEYEPGADFESFKPVSSQALLEKFDASVRDARAALEAATDEAFSVTWTFRWKGQTIFAMPRRDVVRSMVLNHIVHHRAQLGVYLRLNDIAIPGMYGPSADDGPPA